MTSLNVAVAVAIIVREVQFKKYLLSCEYLQIDPAKVYDLDFIKNRIEILRSHWIELNEIEKLNENLKWFEKNYLRLTKKGFRNYNFASRCEKLVTKGKLRVDEISVSDVYVKRELSQKNYDFYSRNKRKRAPVVFAILLVIIILLTLIVLSLQ